MLKLTTFLYNFSKSSMQGHKIVLTSEEFKLFELFRKYREECQLKTVIRVAGGWVRDKLLSRESKDIDIALDDMMGETFVKGLKNWAESSKEVSISGVGVIKSNPENSKNLETATARVNDYSIDFVNLRSEKYTEDSRIPTIVLNEIFEVIGTPLEDAERRDFTINSLFYNIITEEVEDFTQKGLTDLENKVLRTPLDPFVTFKDDPLRILRCLRFKSRLGFEVDPIIYKAMSHPEIKEALSRKVSRERIGKELQGLLEADLFLSGLQDIKDYGLWNIVFKVPEESERTKDQEWVNSVPNFSFDVTKTFIENLKQNGFKTESFLIDESLAHEDLENAEETEKDKKEKKSQERSKIQIKYSPKEFQFLILISSLCYVYKNEIIKMGKAKSTLVEYVIKDELKYSAKVSKFGFHFVESVEKLREIKSLGNESIFKIIRWLRFAEEKWELAIHFLDAVNKVNKEESHFNLYQLRDKIFELNIQSCYLTQPPVSGDALVKKGIKGRNISIALENITIWKILNPNKTVEEFLQELETNLDFFLNANSYQ